MPATGFEHVMQAAEAALQAAGLSVKRHQAGDEAGPEDCPLIVLRRRGTRRQQGAPLGREYHQQGLELECLVAADDWETAADALHSQVHAALTADPVLSACGIELDATEPTGRAGSETVGRLHALYTLSTTLGPDLQPL